MVFHHCCWLPHALQCPSPGRGPRLSRSYQSLALGSLLGDWGARVVGGEQVKQKAHLREGFLSIPLGCHGLCWFGVWVTYPGGFDPALCPTAEEGGRKSRGSMRSKVEGSHREKTKAHGTAATVVA